MEWVERLNVLSSKIQVLLDINLKLKDDNQKLIDEKQLLENSIEKLSKDIEKLKKLSEQHLSERDIIKEKVEKLIQLIN